MINVFDIVHKRLVAEFRTAWGWIMTGEIPVALVVWNRLAQALNALEYELDRSSHALWAKHLYYLLVDFLDSEWLVDGAHRINLLLLWLGKFCPASLVGLLDEVFHLAIFQKLDCRTEHAELFQSCHIDAVIIRIADLRGTGYDNNLLRMQTVEDAQDALLQGSTAHNTVVDDDEIIHIRLDASVGYIIHVARQVVAAVALGDEGTELDILPCYLLRADEVAENIV